MYQVPLPEIQMCHLLGSHPIREAVVLCFKVVATPWESCGLPVEYNLFLLCSTGKEPVDNFGMGKGVDISHILACLFDLKLSQ